MAAPAAPPFTPSAKAAAAGVWNHDPLSPIGPAHWADIGFPVCGSGSRQSPIDIRTATVRVRGGPPLMLESHASELAVENTGHVVEVPIPSDVQDVLRIAGDRYRLSQYHFHAPSEHAINGRRADVEAHFVYQSDAGATAVVAADYRVGPKPNELLERLLLAAPETAGEEAHAGEANPVALLRGLDGVRVKHGSARVESFYGYDGSLTTPSCTEGVRWSVIAHGGQVPREAVTRFHDVIARFPNYARYPDNNRPLQPLNGRVVTLRRDRAHR